MNIRLYRIMMTCALFVGLGFFLLDAGRVIAEVSRAHHRPNYNFLPRLHLNVASLRVIDDATPLPKHESQQMDYTPNELLKDLARQRFACEGKSGEAILNIRQASLVHHLNNYDGKIILSLTMENPAFAKTGNLSAEVYQKVTPKKGESDSDTLLRLTNLLVEDVNTEIETQLHQKFSNWLVQSNEDSSIHSAADTSQNEKNSNSARTPH
ncbi:hypothetical protein FAI40_07560 [Acetobacteraceae bacterium]|nr:hypothetical protein FAI40_07560 [Acetobacteraceae bacterium]